MQDNNLWITSRKLIARAAGSFALSTFSQWITNTKPLTGGYNTSDSQTAYLEGYSNIKVSQEGAYAETQQQLIKVHQEGAYAETQQQILIVHQEGAYAEIQDPFPTSDNQSAYLEGTSTALVTQAPVEVLLKPDTQAGRVSQAPVEVLVKPDTQASRVSQAVVEVLLENIERSSQSAYTKGGIASSDNQGAYLEGQGFASSSQSAYLKTDTKVEVAQAIAYAETEQVKLEVAQAIAYAETEQVKLEVAQAIAYAEVQDPYPSSGTQSVYLAGQDTASDSQPAYLAAHIAAASNQPAFVEGQVASSDSQGAFLHGSKDAGGYGVIDKQTAFGSDDAFALWAGDSTDIIDNYEKSNTDKWLGYRWRDVVIPNGATIAAATLDIRTQSTNDKDPDHTIWAEDSANPPTFTTAIGDISNRTPTTAQILLSYTGGGSGVTWLSELFTLPELKTIIQELVDSYDYSAGAPIVLVVRANGNSFRDLGSFMYEEFGQLGGGPLGTNGPKLHIEWGTHQTAYTKGQDTASSSQFAFMVGGVSDDQAAYLKGQDTASDNHPAYTEGYVPDIEDNQAAYLRGRSTASDNQIAYLLGGIDTSSSVDVYLKGKDSSSSTQGAYLKGYDHTSAAQSAYLLGSIDTVDNQAVYLDGLSTDLSQQPAFVHGKSLGSSSHPSYLKGKDTASATQDAYLDGDAFNSQAQSAFLEGCGERLLPDGDISQSDNWQREDTSTSNLYVSIDEYPYDDADYVWYDNVPAGKYFEVSLENPDNPTVGSGDAKIIWRTRRRAGTQTVTIKVELRESTTVIASQSKVLTDTDTTHVYTLTSGEKASITNWSDLRLRFVVESVV